MGWVAVVLLPAIGGFSGWVIVHNADYPASTVGLAASALLIDSLGLVLSVWRIVFGSRSERLTPATHELVARDEGSGPDPRDRSIAAIRDREQCPVPDAATAT
jgi:hypothetical protein